MDGRIPRAGERLVELDGKQGVIYEMSKEEEAFDRWQHRQFLDLERQIVKVWRRNVTNIDHSANYALFKEFYGSFRKPRTLADAKHIADTLIDLMDEEKAIRFGLALLGVPIDFHDRVIGRWVAGGKRPIGEFAPYFRHMFSVDFFFKLAIAADLISRVRLAGKADSKVDIAYLYYLPCCMVFVSSDKLHERVVPLFLRDNQSLLRGPGTEDDLKRIDEYYAQLPPELTSQGLYKFARSPPDGVAPLVTRLWDKHLLPTWREKKDQSKDKTPGDDAAVIEIHLPHAASCQPHLHHTAEHPRRLHPANRHHTRPAHHRRQRRQPSRPRSPRSHPGSNTIARVSERLIVGR
jgi:hypothetical protein